MAGKYLWSVSVMKDNYMATYSTCFAIHVVFVFFSKISTFLHTKTFLILERWTERDTQRAHYNPV